MSLVVQRSFHYFLPNEKWISKLLKSSSLGIQSSRINCHLTVLSSQFSSSISSLKRTSTSLTNNSIDILKVSSRVTFVTWTKPLLLDSSSSIPSSPGSNATPTTNSKGPRLLIKYSFAKDSKASVIKTPFPSDKQRLSVEDIKEYLIHDGVNLSNIGQIRFYKPKYDSFQAIPQNGINLSKLVDNTLILQFEKTRRNADIIGPMFYFDPNVGFFLDTLNPGMNFKFSSTGELQERFYQAEIKCIGLKAELAIRAQIAFALHPPFKELSRHHEIELGRGIDVAFGWFHLTYASFKNSSGGILMGGLTLGFGIGASLVVSGKLVPIPVPAPATPVKGN